MRSCLPHDSEGVQCPVSGHTHADWHGREQLRWLLGVGHLQLRGRQVKGKARHRVVLPAACSQPRVWARKTSDAGGTSLVKWAAKQEQSITGVLQSPFWSRAYVGGSLPPCTHPASQFWEPTGHLRSPGSERYFEKAAPASSSGVAFSSGPLGCLGLLYQPQDVESGSLSSAGKPEQPAAWTREERQCTHDGGAVR